VSRWFRWYEGTVEDGKFRTVARMSRVTIRDVVALWAFILEDAANLEHRGVCERDEIFMSSVLDFEDGVVQTILRAMQELEMLTVNPTSISVCNWGKRQFESDIDTTATGRQKRKRERDAPEHHAPVTRDAATSEKSRLQNTESKKEDIRAVANATRPEIEKAFDDEFWKAYPKRDGANPKSTARKLFLAAVKAGTTAAEIIAAARRYADEERRLSHIGTPLVAQAVTWLRQTRWTDYAATAPPVNQPAYLTPPPGCEPIEVIRARYAATNGNPNATGSKTEVRSDAGMGEVGAD